MEPKQGPARDLEQTVRLAAESLGQWSDDDASRPPGPGKWSPKEVLGHLVDSASNNHGRFVRASLQDEMVFPGYAQDDWVSSQRYGDAPWSELLELWKGFNLHLARFMANVPEDVRTRPITRHNLQEIAWETPPQGEPVTLGFFMADYVNHLKHHLRQIDVGLADEPAPQLSLGKRKSR